MHIAAHAVKIAVATYLGELIRPNFDTADAQLSHCIVGGKHL